MITVKKVDKENYKEVLSIEMHGEQAKYVKPNVYSLAQAWVFSDIARPFAIYNDDQVIGFIMLKWDEEEREASIWRFMIAEEHQGKGYGRKALEYVLHMIRKSNKFDCIYLEYVPGNDGAKHLYESLGFKATGYIDCGEIYMEIDLEKGE